MTTKRSVRLKRFLLAALLIFSIAGAAVLLFLAGDHDEEYQHIVPQPTPE
jgi:hypothetical protein